MTKRSPVVAQIGRDEICEAAPLLVLHRPYAPIPRKIRCTTSAPTCSTSPCAAATLPTRSAAAPWTVLHVNSRSPGAGGAAMTPVVYSPWNSPGCRPQFTVSAYLQAGAPRFPFVRKLPFGYFLSVCSENLHSPLASKGRFGFADSNLQGCFPNPCSMGCSPI